MPTPISKLPFQARVYVLFVVAAGVATIASSILGVIYQSVRPGWWILAGLTILTGSFSLKVPGVSARISVSEAFVFVAVLLFGRDPAILIVALDALILSSWLKTSNRSILRPLFNMSAGVVAISLSAMLFESLLPDGAVPTQLERLLFPVLVLAVVYFAINSLLIAVALGFEQKRSPLEIWRSSFVWLSLNYLGGASVALLLYSYTRNVDLTAMGVIVPLLITTYLTFRTSLGRLEDAKKHVAQVDDLYLSTVETLAMAVDAKDQITHGHIRRVQVYAIELAKRLGVTDDQQLKAIAVAALLHDMGKLAIPEHILNKPGRLTAAEFQRMKQHADLGADLLSSIRFPFPVVPIVRHHHENWDGSGYPTGISRTDIPIGARILSVVDCFDALTSDRPYRPKLTNEEAFKILHQRRGSMYDPLVVDEFTKAHAEISPAANRAGDEARTVFASEQTEHPGATPLQQIRANATEGSILGVYRGKLATSRGFNESFELTVQCLRQLAPGTAFALYRYDAQSDTLTCHTSSGDPDKLLPGLKVSMGERVTGWCAANRRIALNSDVSLDLAQVAQSFEPPLRSMASIPLVQGDRVNAVLNVYSTKRDAFSEGQRYAFEQIASIAADQLSKNVDLHSPVISFPIRMNS